jgi:hypothetical protein
VALEPKEMVEQVQEVLDQADSSTDVGGALWIGSVFQVSPEFELKRVE